MTLETMRKLLAHPIRSLERRNPEATMPTTIYEPGVLFLRVTHFRQLLRTFNSRDEGVRPMTFQVTREGLLFGDVRLGFSIGDMLQYADPGVAPARHPDEDPMNQPSDPQGWLFER